MTSLLQNSSEPLIPAPIRFRYPGTVGTPLTDDGGRCRGRTWGPKSFKGIKAVNGLFGRSGTVTLTVSPRNRSAVTVTVQNRYGRTP